MSGQYPRPNPHAFIPGYRIRYIELENACTFLRDNGWAGGIGLDEAVRALAASQPRNEDGLDVDRLARALAASHDEEGVIGALGHGGDPRLGNAAERGPWASAYLNLAKEVAAEYAAQSGEAAGEGAEK